MSELARWLGAAKSSVFRWKQALERGGREALRSKPHPGKACRRSAQQKQRLVKMLWKGPLAAGYATDLWTCARVAEVIQRSLGVEDPVDHVWRLRDALGWSCQQPEQRARERNAAAIRCGRQRDWPGIKKSAAPAGEHRFARCKRLFAAAGAASHLGSSRSNTPATRLGSSRAALDDRGPFGLCATASPRPVLPNPRPKPAQTADGGVSHLAASPTAAQEHPGLRSLERALQRCPLVHAAAARLV